MKHFLTLKAKLRVQFLLFENSAVQTLILNVWRA